MELRQLEYFVAVAEERSFTRAAARVHISQSGVSAQIKALERELGAELIARPTGSGSRSVGLTAAGASALGHARAALAAAGALGHAVDEVSQVVRGSLTVGMVVGCAVLPLFEALARFHTAHDGVALLLAEDGSDRLIEQVRAGALDIALVGVAGQLPAGLAGLTLVSERLAAVVPAGHWLARGGRSSATLAEVAAHGLIALPPGTGIRTVLDRACAAQGLSPSIALEASAPEAVLALAALGLGVGVLSETTARTDDAAIHALPIDDVELPALLALVWSPSPSPAVLAFVADCGAAFGL